ncbi:MAG: hypothetical protein LDL30_09160 [Desulfovibrio sp.]|nr:hypothetical protein [Desulfovibrio sp.]
MAPPVKIKRSQKKAGGAGGKGANPSGGAAFGRPVQMILATAAVTAVLVVAANHYLPRIQQLTSGSPATTRQPVVPFPPIGQSQTRPLPTTSAPPAPPAPLPADNASPAQAQAPATAAESLSGPSAAPPASAPAPPPAPGGGQGQAVQQALQDAARLAAAPPEAPPAPPARSTPAAVAGKGGSAKAGAPTPQKDPPITAEERNHMNSLVSARVEKVQGRCLLRVTTAKPFMRFKWMQLDGPPRVALDLVGSWDVNAMTRDRGDGLCARELRLGRHPDRVRLVVELAGGSTVGPRTAVVEKLSPTELLVTLPHR